MKDLIIALALVAIFTGICKIIDVIAAASLIRSHDKARQRETKAKERTEKLLAEIQAERRLNRKPWTVIDQIEGEPAREGRMYPDNGLIIMETMESTVGQHEREAERFAEKKMFLKIPIVFNFALREVYDQVIEQGWFYLKPSESKRYRISQKVYLGFEHSCGNVQQLVEVTDNRSQPGTNLRKIVFKIVP